MPRIIHFGRDGCWRMSVLRNAGFDVVGCTSFDALLALLDVGASADAVVITEASELDLSELGEHSNVPLILFQSTLANVPAHGFDLVVAPQTHPEMWLRDLGATIELRKTLAASARNESAGPTIQCDDQIAMDVEAKANRVGDWHSVAVSIARKQTLPARSDVQESAVRSAKPARQL